MPIVARETVSSATMRLSTTETSCTASDVTLSLALFSMVRDSTRIERDAEDGDDDEHDGERRVDQPAAHVRPSGREAGGRRTADGAEGRAPASQLFSKRKPTPRTVAM